MVEILKQDKYTPLKVWQQVVILYTGVGGFFDKLDLSDISVFENRIYLEWNKHAIYKPFTIVFDSSKLSDNLNKDILGSLIYFFLVYVYATAKIVLPLTKLKKWVN